MSHLSDWAILDCYNLPNNLLGQPAIAETWFLIPHQTGDLYADVIWPTDDDSVAKIQYLKDKECELRLEAKICYYS